MIKVGESLLERNRMEQRVYYKVVKQSMKETGCYREFM